MDILSHALWAAAATKAVNLKKGKNRKTEKINPHWAAFWSIFPDIFAFAGFSFWFSFGFLFGNLGMEDLPRYVMVEPFPPDTLFIYKMTHVFYAATHSLVIFSLMVAGFFFLKKVFIKNRNIFGAIFFWEMGGWLLHIVSDVFTHPYNLSPTPVLWPISLWKFEGGIAGETPWFVITNFAVLGLIYLFFYRGNIGRMFKRGTGLLKP